MEVELKGERDLLQLDLNAKPSDHEMGIFSKYGLQSSELVLFISLALKKKNHFAQLWMVRCLYHLCFMIHL